MNHFNMISPFGPHKTIIRGRSVPEETIYKANKLYWDDKLSITQIREVLKISIPKLDRILFTSLGEWQKWKEK